MEIRIKDFLCFDYFKSLRLLAGADGLSRPVTGCGVLDYELDRSFNEKYIHSNFLPGQLALTSALFAKDNPFLLRDALKFLVARDCSGLVIKNVFRLPIHESILRYANSKQFPVFLMGDPQMFFEDFIIQADHLMASIKNTEFAESELNRLLHHPMERYEEKIIAQRLFPFFQNQYVVLHFRLSHVLSDQALLSLNSLRNVFAGDDTSTTMLRYQKGMFLFLSQDLLTPDIIFRCVNTLLSVYPDSYVGVSGTHFQVGDTRCALQEAMYASEIHHLKSKNRIAAPILYQSYTDLGVYQVLLPVKGHDVLHQYANRVLEPILEFDAENRGSLLQTLVDFVQCGGDLRSLAQYSGQHENTLRYRLDKIAGITGLSYKKLAEYEQLALGVRIYLLLQESID